MPCCYSGGAFDYKPPRGSQATLLVLALTFICRDGPLTAFLGSFYSAEPSVSAVKTRLNEQKVEWLRACALELRCCLG